MPGGDHGIKGVGTLNSAGSSFEMKYSFKTKRVLLIVLPTIIKDNTN